MGRWKEENPCSDAVGWEQRLGEELSDNGREVRAAQGGLAQGPAERGTEGLARRLLEVAAMRLDEPPTSGCAEAPGCQVD